MGGAGVSYHEHSEAVLTVGFLNHVKDLCHVYSGFPEVSGHDNGHYGGHAAFGGDQGWVSGLVVVGQWYDYIRAKGGDVGVHLFGLLPEFGVVHVKRVRLDDDYLADRRGAA